MNLLLDANVLLWSLADRKRLTPRVRDLLEDDSNEVVVSRTTIWELSIKVAKGKLPMPGSTIRSLIEQIELTGLKVVNLEDKHILLAETLPHHHGGPFDRILIAQALAEGLTILTSDSEIPKYAVPVVWH